MTRTIAMKTLLSGRRLVQAFLAAGLALVVGCHLPLTGRSGATLAGRAILPDVSAASSRQPANEGVILEVEKPVPMSVPQGSGAQALPAVDVAQGTQAAPLELPTALSGKPYGGVTLGIKWPELKSAPYRAQFIPGSAKSVRIRVIGSDGTDRLAVMFFRDESPSNTLTQRQTFFLPVEPGLLVEVRAYEKTRSELTEKATPTAKFNPTAFKEYELANERVLAEGFAFNVQIVLLKETKVKVELDTSQLVAGIGGNSGITSGGDPYFENFVSRARFAELWDPAHVYYDSNAKRLFWTEFPVFKSVTDPKERDIIRQLSPAGVNATESANVLLWSVGGDRIVERNGDNNPPDCAEIKNVSGLFWSAKGPTLYIAQQNSSGFASSVRKLSPPNALGKMSSISQFRSDTGTTRNFPSVAAMLDGSDEVLSVDTVGKKVMINRSESPFPILMGAGTISVEASVSVDQGTTLLSDPRAVAGFGMDEYAVINGSTVIHAVNGLVRVKAGGGGTAPVLTINASNAPAQNFSIGNPIDIKFDPIKQVAGSRVAYVADNVNNALWRLYFGAAITDNATASVIATFSVSPRSIAADPDGDAVYVLKIDGKIDKVTTTTGVPVTTSLTLAARTSATAIAAGTGTGGFDQLFIADSAPLTANTIVAVIAENGGTATNLFGQVDRNELSVGDCSDFAGQLNSGGNPVEFAKFSQPNGDPDGAANLTKPTWLAAGKGPIANTGYLYIADTGNNRIRRVTFNDKHAPTSIVSLVTAKNLDSKPSRLDSPQGVDVDEFGNVFICDTNNHQIVVWRPCDGQFVYDLGLLSIAGSGKSGLNFDNINARLVQLNGPKAVRVEQNPTANPSRRRVFFIDQGKRIRMLTPRNSTSTPPQNATLTAGAACPNDPYFDYIISTIAGAGTEPADLNVNAANVQLDSPVDLAVDSSGYVYVADGSKVRRIDPIIGSIATVYKAPNALTSISIDAARKELYFTMQNSVSVRKVFLGD